MFQSPYMPYIQQQMQQNQFSQFQQTQPQIPTQNLIRVNGIDGAKAYQMTPNSTVALFDSNEDILYVKSTDGAGFPQIRKFRFVEIQESQTQQTENVDFVSREEFENFKKEIMSNGKQSVRKSESNE